MLSSLNETGSHKTKLFAVTVVLLSIISLVACVAAIPLAVKYAKEKDMAKLTLNVEGKAEEIYDASVRTFKRNNPDLEVIKDKDLKFETKKMTPEGKELWASWKVKQKDEKMVEVEFKIKIEDMEEEAVEQRAIKGIQAFCDEIERRCKIEK